MGKRKILLLAGEASGLLYRDRIAALLGDAEVRGYADYGFRTEDLAVMGFIPVLRRLFYFLRVKRTLKRAIDTWRPDVVCTIDYPGLNLCLAAYAKSRGIRTVHVVCPQVWAWKKGRIPKIEAVLDRLYCFFPFEPSLFKAGFAKFVGHPLAAEFAAYTTTPAREKGLVAILPGSRQGEIARIFPTLIEVMKTLSGRLSRLPRFVIPAADEAAYQRLTAALTQAAVPWTALDAPSLPHMGVAVWRGHARELLRCADSAVVASGTATLEAALARCPTVLVYKVSRSLAWFARRVIKDIHYVGLANIVWEKCGAQGENPMPEFLQEAFTTEAVIKQLTSWLENEKDRTAAVARLDETMKNLSPGSLGLAEIAQDLLSNARG